MKGSEILDNSMKTGDNNPQNEPRVAAGESKAALPSYEGPNEEQLWGKLVRDASKLHKEFTASGQEMPEGQLQALRARVKRLEHMPNFRTWVGLAAWAGEIDKYGGMEVPIILFGEDSTSTTEAAKIVSDFAGYKVPSFRERKEDKLSFTRALLAAHRAFLKKRESLKGVNIDEAQREALAEAKAADRELQGFLWSTKDAEIYRAMVEENLTRDVASEAEARKKMTAEAEEDIPRTEGEREVFIRDLEAERDRFWEEARREESMKDALRSLQGMVRVSGRIKEARVMPLGIAPEEREVVPEKEMERMVDELMERIGTMSPDEFQAGLENLKRYAPREDTAIVVSILTGRAKAKRERVEAMPAPAPSERASFREKIQALRQLRKKLYAEKQLVVLEDMAEAVRSGEGRIGESAAMQEIEERIAKTRKRIDKMFGEQAEQKEKRDQKSQIINAQGEFVEGGGE